MPNWCFNELTVSGSAEAMAEFYTMLDNDSEFRMNSFLPQPEELRGTTSPNQFRPLDEKKPEVINGSVVMIEVDADGLTLEEFTAHKAELREKYGYDNWYDWNIANYGTKWDLNDAGEQYRNETSYGVCYDTAWSPNCEFVVAISAMFPELEFELTYNESGMGFAGKLTASGGDYNDEDIPYTFLNLKSLEDNKYQFISDDSDEDADTIYDVFDGDWAEALYNAGIYEDDIVNLDELKAHFGDTDDE